MRWRAHDLAPQMKKPTHAHDGSHTLHRMDPHAGLVHALAVRGLGRTGAQRLREIVGCAFPVRVEVDTSGDSVPKAAGREMRVRTSVTECRPSNGSGTLARIRGVEPKEAWRA